MVTSQNTASIRHVTLIHSKFRGDSQNSPCEQQRAQLTMFLSKISGRNMTANVVHVLYSTKMATRSRSRVSPLNFSSMDGYGTVRPTLRPCYGRNIRPWSAAYGCPAFMTWYFLFKGAPSRESRTGSWLVIPVVGREKKFGHPII